MRNSPVTVTLLTLFLASQSHGARVGELCHTLHTKECLIRMVPTFTPVKMQRCRGEEKKDSCAEGVKTQCATKYQTRCSSIMVYKEQEEDFPKCRVEKVKTCKEEQKEDRFLEWKNMVENTQPLVKKKQCSQVGVLRCTMSRRITKRAKPQTRCKRVPRSFC